MDIAQDILDRIGQPESELLEYKAVLPPAATVAQLIGAFANANGGAIVLGVVENGKDVLINGLSDEFRAVQITRKAIDLLSPQPAVKYDYVVHEGKRLFVIEVQKSAAAVLLGGKSYVRTGNRTVLTQVAPGKAIQNAGIARLSATLQDEPQVLHGRASEAAGPLRKRAADPRRPRQAPLSQRVKRADRQRRRQDADADSFLVLRGQRSKSSCRTCFTRSTSQSPRPSNRTRTVTVKEVLDCSDMQEFISRYAKRS